MKKAVFLIVLILTLITINPLFFSVYAETVPTYKVLHDNTPLYKNPSSESDVLFILNQGAELFFDNDTEFISENIIFVEVKFGNYTGYINKDSIYKIVPPITFSATHAKIRTEKFGKTCSVYTAPDINSEVAFEIKDSKRVEKLFNANKDFFYIKSEGKTGYIKSEYVIEKGLTQNEKVALIIGCVGFVFLLAILLLIGYSKSLSKKSNR